MPDSPENAHRPRHLTREAALADFARYALDAGDLESVLQEACVQVARALEMPIAKVLEALPDGRTLLLRAAVGIPPDLARPGATRVPAGHGSAAGYAVEKQKPVISYVRTEDRFEPSELVRRAGVLLSANVVIQDGDAPFGALEVDDRVERPVSTEDVDFLQAYANVLASAVERQRAAARVLALAQERELLMRELQHRVKNMLAKIRALANQTIDSSPDLATFREKFDRRLAAIARTQELFADGAHGGAELRTLIRRELEAHGAREGAQFTLEGPDMMISPRAVQSLGMAFHELATNAIKYGALGAANGRITVRWRIDDVDGAEDIVLEWIETGMDIREPPARRGFGSEIIQEGLAYMLGGTSELTFPRQGARSVMRFPLSSIVLTREPASAQPYGSIAL